MKEIVLTKRSLSTYRNCARAQPGDRCIKTRPRAAHEANPFFCPEHFFTENIT